MFQLKLFFLKIAEIKYQGFHTKQGHWSGKITIYYGHITTATLPISLLLTRVTDEIIELNVKNSCSRIGNQQHRFLRKRIYEVKTFV